jgi:hypothetical protein
LPEDDKAASGMVQSISDNLGAFFRHLFPGIIIMGAAYVAHPCWFSRVDTHSWQHILIVAVIAVASGNLWFAINRYAFHQFVDYVMYRCGSKGPAPASSRPQYLDDVAKHATDSLCLCIPSRARQHIAFRASSILLLYTVAELGFLAAFWSDSDTLFARHRCWTFFVSFAVLVFAIWQNVIARRVDYYVIEFARTKKSE